MTQASDAAGAPTSDALRLTAFGAFLRRSSLDEWPQLVNVLRGDMSLVGPRPLLPHYVPRYSQTQARRHEVLPGITGWAQINGRNSLAWPAKLALDVWYVEHWSLPLDVQILLKTFGAVLAGRDAQHPSHVSMPEFTGEGP